MPGDCIYGEEESKVHGAQLLEDRIDQLKTRIACLENNASGPILLHDPYALFRERQEELGTRSGRNRQDLAPNVAQSLYVLYFDQSVRN